MSERVYVVRLKECELDELKEICSPEMNEATLRHARPEHPERQAALEELAEAVTATPINLDWIHRIKRRLRSLEAK